MDEDYTIPEPTPFQQDQGFQEPWDQSSEVRLQRLSRAVSDVTQKREDGFLDEGTATDLMGQMVGRRNGLLAKKQASVEKQKQQAVQDGMQQMALSQSVQQANARHSAENFHLAASTLTDPDTGRQVMYAPKGYDQVDFGEAVNPGEGGGGSGTAEAPASSAEEGGKEEVAGAAPEPQQHVLTINGQTVTYNRTPDGGWKAEQGGPSAAMRLFAEQGSDADPSVQRQAMLDNDILRRGGILPPSSYRMPDQSSPIDGLHPAQYRRYVQEATKMYGGLPNGAAKTRAIADQVHLWGTEAVRRDRDERLAKQREEFATKREKAREDLTEKKQKEKEKNDNYEKNIKHFIDKLESERRYNDEKGKEQPDFLKDHTSIHEEAEKRAAELHKSKYGHYPEGFLAKQPGQEGVGQTQQQPGEPKPKTDLPVVPAGKSDLAALLAEKQRRAAKPISADAFMDLTGSGRH